MEWEYYAIYITSLFHLQIATSIHDILTLISNFFLLYTCWNTYVDNMGENVVSVLILSISVSLFRVLVMRFFVAHCALRQNCAFVVQWFRALALVLDRRFPSIDSALTGLVILGKSPTHCKPSFQQKGIKERA